MRLHRTVRVMSAVFLLGVFLAATPKGEVARSQSLSSFTDPSPHKSAFAHVNGIELNASPEILECHQAGITVTLPKPMTSGAKAAGRFGKQDFGYLPDEDAYRCPAGERLTYRYSNEEDGKELRHSWTTACGPAR